MGLIESRHHLSVLGWGDRDGSDCHHRAAASESLSKPLPSIIAVLCFVAAFWLLSFPLRTMPTGVVYAVWSGLAIVLITAIAWVWSKQVLDYPALIGMALITAGVIVINMFIQNRKGRRLRTRLWRGQT